MSEQALAWSPSFTDRVQELLERIDYRPAETDEDKEAIFRLRYEAYRREGFVEVGRRRRYYADLSDALVLRVNLL